MPPEQALALIAGTNLTVMLPDQAEKGVGRHLPPWARITLVAVLVAPFAALGGPWAALAATVAIAPWPHRGVVTHDPLIVGPMLLAPVMVFHPHGWVGVGVYAALLGCAAHLLADSPTIYGLPFWPIRERLHLAPMRLRVRVGSRRERALATCVAVGLATYCAWLTVEFAMYCARLLGLA